MHCISNALYRGCLTQDVTAIFQSCVSVYAINRRNGYYSIEGRPAVLICVDLVMFYINAVEIQMYFGNIFKNEPTNC